MIQWKMKNYFYSLEEKTNKEVRIIGLAWLLLTDVILIITTHGEKMLFCRLGIFRQDIETSACILSIILKNDALSSIILAGFFVGYGIALFIIFRAITLLVHIFWMTFARIFNLPANPFTIFNQIIKVTIKLIIKKISAIFQKSKFYWRTKKYRSSRIISNILERKILQLEKFLSKPDPLVKWANKAKVRYAKFHSI